MCVNSLLHTEEEGRGLKEALLMVIRVTPISSVTTTLLLMHPQKGWKHRQCVIMNNRNAIDSHDCIDATTAVDSRYADDAATFIRSQ